MSTGTSVRPTANRPMTTASRLLPGCVATAIAVAASMAVGTAVPTVSALTAAVVLGILANNIPGLLPGVARPGLAWATRRLLRGGVVLLGLQLAVPQLLRLGGGTLLAVLITVLVTFFGTRLLGRLIGVSNGLGLLVATGFSICGASAVAAMEGVAEADDEDVATSVALVTVFGGLSMFLLPVLFPVLGLHGMTAGRLAGASVHEVAQVVAAASAAGTGAVATAVVVKLSRVVLLAPLVAGVGLVKRRTQGRSNTSAARPPIIPLFVLGFLAMVGIRSLGVLPTGLLDATKPLTTVLLAGALFGLGTTVHIRKLITTGPRALLLGLCSTILVTTTAYFALSSLA